MFCGDDVVRVLMSLSHVRLKTCLRPPFVDLLLYLLPLGLLLVAVYVRGARSEIAIVRGFVSKGFGRNVSLTFFCQAGVVV